MEIDSDDGHNELVNHIQSVIDVRSPEFCEMVNNLAKGFGIVQHPNPVITLSAINKHIEAIKAPSTTYNNYPDHMISLTSVEMGARTTNSPNLDNAIRILRLVHDKQLREAQTNINKVIAENWKMRVRPNILITGTPGTGKTTLARNIAEDLSMEYIDITREILNGKFYTEYDSKLDSYVLDEDKLLDFLEEPLNLEQGGIVLDYHSSDFFPKRWFDFVFVLRCDTETLYDRLTERGYSERKRRENIECEIFGTVAEEAKESYDENIVFELSNNNKHEMARNMATVTELLGKYRPSG